jgi:predicted amidohydrolase YtcJ
MKTYEGAAVEADAVLLNGVIHTANANDTTVKALAIKDGKILALGSSGEMEIYIGSGTEVTDLAGKMVLPGMIDSHLHPPGNALVELYNIYLSQQDDKDTILAKAAKFISANPGLDAYYGSGWSVGVFEGEEIIRGPKKEHLDAISPDKPVILTSYDGHSIWANSKALEIAGITKDTPDPKAGVIERAPVTGEPWGTLKEAAMELLPNEKYTSAQLIEGVKAFQALMHSLGYTGIFSATFSAGMGDETYKVFKLLEDKGELKMWVRASERIDITRNEELETQIANLKRLRDTYSGELFKVTNAKFFVDGVIEGATAKLLQPYEKAAGKGNGYYGVYSWEDMDALKQVFTTLNSEGLQIHVHSIGDRATRDTLDAFEYALKQVPGEHRNAITHLQLVAPEDIPRFKELGVIANCQAYWHLKEPEWWEVVDFPFLGKRAENEYPLGSFFRSRAVVASSSDYPVTDPPNPLRAIQVGVTRNLNREERSSLTDMIKSFTANNAYALFLDDVTGTIEVGKYADLVILGQNLFSIDPLDIDGVRVLTTMFRGEVVYEAGQ